MCAEFGCAACSHFEIAAVVGQPEEQPFRTGMLIYVALQLEQVDESFYPIVRASTAALLLELHLDGNLSWCDTANEVHMTRTEIS